MFLDPKLEPTIREIIDWRLKKGGNDCHISIKRLAKQAIDRLGYEDTLGARNWMHKAVFRVLEQYDIKLWGYRSKSNQIRDKDNMPLSLHIYRVKG